jgi:hypothetical protein
MEAGMAGGDEPGRHQCSVEDLKFWLSQELKDIEKARELRIKEATGIVDSVLRGELTPDEGFSRTNEYENRWGEALPGARAKPGVTDDEIIARIDRANSDDDARTDAIQRRVRTRLPSLSPPSRKL